ncbi:MAG: hypothetical protein V4439_00395 [Patescibacteria group bacterium]
MDQNFQTSFIPKKPMVEERAVASRPVGLLTILSVFIFFTMVLAGGGLYFYKTVLTKNIAQMEIDLNVAKERFEPKKLNQIQILDKRLQAANEVLDKHVAISPIFDTLSKVTLKTVRYTKFSYELGADNSSKVDVKMSGQAIGYRSIALQSDLFTKDKYIIDPIFSNLSLDDKGNVLFDLEFFVDPSFVDYKQTLGSTGDNLPN